MNCVHLKDAGEKQKVPDILQYKIFFNILNIQKEIDNGDIN